MINIFFSHMWSTDETGYREFKYRLSVFKYDLSTFKINLSAISFHYRTSEDKYDPKYMGSKVVINHFDSLSSLITTYDFISPPLISNCGRGRPQPSRVQSFCFSHMNIQPWKCQQIHQASCHLDEQNIFIFLQQR